ncbi:MULTISPECIES: hypothetical protein [Actinomycetes]|uniref:Uncharacterized protein n=2 Tax=Actinomycetes TaxID=1760 RepID=A0ABP6M2W5_9MICC
MTPEADLAAPLMLDPRHLDSETLDPHLVDDLVRAEQQGAPSVLWVTRAEDLSVPVAAVVTHVAVPTSTEAALQQEVRERVGPERMLLAPTLEAAGEAVRAQREQERARREAERARAAADGGPLLRRVVRRLVRRVRGRPASASPGSGR